MRRFSLLLVSLIAVGCGSPAADVAPTAEAPAPKAAEAEVTAVAFNVDDSPVVEFETPGMHCSACAANIVKALRDKPGIVDVKANAETKIVTVAVDESEFTPETAIKAVEEAGFGEATLVEDSAS